MADKKDKDEKLIISPISFAEVMGDNAELKAMPNEVLQCLMKATNAHSSIVLTFDTMPLQGKSMKYEISTVNVPNELIVPVLTHIVQALMGQLPGAEIKSGKPGNLNSDK